jgi:hypothetical protein
MPHQHQGPIRVRCLHLTGSRHRVVSEMSSRDVRGLGALSVVPNIEEEDGEPFSEQGLRQKGHPAVARTPSVNQDHHRTTSIHLRLQEPPSQTLPQGVEGVLTALEGKVPDVPGVHLPSGTDREESQAVQDQNGRYGHQARRDQERGRQGHRRASTSRGRTTRIPS